MVRTHDWETAVCGMDWRGVNWRWGISKVHLPIGDQGLTVDEELKRRSCQ
jgi:hypothetical protein